MTLEQEMIQAVKDAIEGVEPEVEYDDELQYEAEAAVAAVRDVIRRRLASVIPAKERQQLLMMLFVTGEKFGFCHADESTTCWLRDAHNQLAEEVAREPAPLPSTS